MRYELSDYEWTAIKPMLPNKPRAACGVQVTVACSIASFGSYVQVRDGATCQRTMGPRLPAGFRSLQIS
jgi:transposase